jgi:hypothetical protein
MYRRIDPGASGVRLIEKRAEAPRGGWVKYVEIPLYTHPAAAQPSRAEVLEQAAQWQWRWIGDADDAWRNSTRAECERIAGFAPEKQHWEVRTLYIHPAAARSQGQP